ncbi:16S rRNA (adenine(1518)-N(6)/adenine(1519)-N(6))-dimethyltransferase RsmA [Congregibacter litoralis]|uniref:Ribosomal RNA small subunit methyltransferase A n=1 Tax=Congregibacter litoralis KT71 TaxID=314285 RepID=A4A6V3_9GAMM|nr:16S rRNA (adenine(1518)-N(6)/adenine(1519)-N(6))-dimethyltransferase RsmA [Congregibacter litoralis]EAQ98022.1 dimethyladenosine transferase [Congregibacter litoralis KT71]
MSKPRPPSHQPRKRFGQNFLRDPGVIDRLERAIAPAASQHLVEIGPGLGALTDALLQSGCQLDAIELDRDLVTPLLAAFSIHPNFTLHSADALKFDFSSVVRGEEQLRVVGNLPYNISTPLIFRLLEQAPIIKDMHFMLQLEVVQRLTATPGNKHWGRLGIMAQYLCRTELLFEVPPEAFDPPPKVQSAIIRLTPHQSPLYPDCDSKILEKVVKAAFAQRRKTLRNNLKGLLTDEAIEATGIDPGCRAETLALARFVALAEQLENSQP